MAATAPPPTVNPAPAAPFLPPSSSPAAPPAAATAVPPPAHLVRVTPHSAPLLPPPHLPSVSVLPAPPLAGRDKWLGGMTSPCGRYVYGVPGTAATVLRVDTAGDGPPVGACPAPDGTDAAWAGKFKWLRGETVPPRSDTGFRGCCLALPCNATHGVLRIDADGVATVVGGPHLDGGRTPIGEAGEAGEKGADGRWRANWLYHGGACLSDGFVYAVPCNATRILRVHPETGECAYVGPECPGRQKWYGGIVAANGSMYGIPQSAASVLKVTPAPTLYGDGAQFELLTSPLLPAGGWKWHGGTADAAGRYVYGYPNNADRILKIDTVDDTVALVGDPAVIQSGRHRSDGKYKYLGGAVCPLDHNLYLFPSDAERVLCVETATDRTYCVGPELLEGPNKYQNGFAGRDGAVYGIPQRAPGILRILPAAGRTTGADRTVYVDELAIPDDAVTACKHKFEGGVLGDDGRIYCMPLDTGKVVAVDVPPPPPTPVT